MRGVKVLVVAVLLWAMPLVATGQEKAGPETEAQKLTVAPWRTSRQWHSLRVA
jgi:hypothetical protein